MHWDRKIDGLLAQALMSIQAVKGVEIGQAFAQAGMPGSSAHDAISYDAERLLGRRLPCARPLEPVGSRAA